MFYRELSNRERELLLMIEPITFRDIVEIVRKEVYSSRYGTRRKLMMLKNGTIDGSNGDNKNNDGDLNIRENS